MTSPANSGKDGNSENPKLYDGNQIPIKRFKACRSCRKQKIKCEGNVGFSCSKCAVGGHECIFDIIETKGPKVDGGENDVEKRIGLLESEVQSLRATLITLTDTNDSRPPKRRRLQSPQREDPPTHDETELTIFSKDAYTTYRDFSVLQLDASFGEIMSGSLGRELYEVYFARCNVALPLFDPVYDTFDSLQRRSPLCSSAIVSVAALLLSKSSKMNKIHDHFREEADRSAAQTLFRRQLDLETVQGLVVLAAYSEHGLFALEHAVRVAQQIGLDTAISQLLDELGLTRGCSNTSSLLNSSRHITLIRKARVWLVINHFKQTYYSYTKTVSATRYNTGSELRTLINLLPYPVFDLSRLAILDILELRDGFDVTDVSENSASFSERLSTSMRSYSHFWDSVLNGSGYDEESFQKTFYNIQKQGVVVHILCSRIEFLVQSPPLLSTGPDIHSILCQIRSYIKAILDLIFEHQSYLWVLRASPVIYVLETVHFVSLLRETSNWLPSQELSNYVRERKRQLDTILHNYRFIKSGEPEEILTNDTCVSLTKTSLERLKSTLALLPSSLPRCSGMDNDGWTHGHAQIPVVNDHFEDSSITLGVIENINTDAGEDQLPEVTRISNTSKDGGFETTSLEFDAQLNAAEDPPLIDEIPEWALAPPYVYEF
ncbi:hypothetical protein F5884DRAFT_230180 [Xylogone sp. PMI_703]|nr:hypothetical protein F5884DRAFT_230180 [Xylogone sp. PMI_703]